MGNEDSIRVFVNFSGGTLSREMGIVGLDECCWEAGRIGFVRSGPGLILESYRVLKSASNFTKTL